MTESSTAGMRFRKALAAEKPLQIAGVINAYAARLAERAGFRAIYLSGGGVAAASLGVPDLGITTLEDVLIDARRITDVTGLPLLVDVDTGFGGAFNIARTVRSLMKAGRGRAAHRGPGAGQALRSPPGQGPGFERGDGRPDQSRGGCAQRTRLLASWRAPTRWRWKGLAAALERAAAYVEAGADMLFAEAVTDPAMYARVCPGGGVPILANMTEFGKTPLLTVERAWPGRGRYGALPAVGLPGDERGGADASIQPSARRALRQGWLREMQTRDELYDVLGYHAYEQKLDELFAKEKQE